MLLQDVAFDAIFGKTTGEESLHRFFSIVNRQS